MIRKNLKAIAPIAFIVLVFALLVSLLLGQEHLAVVAMAIWWVIAIAYNLLPKEADVENLGCSESNAADAESGRPQKSSKIIQLVVMTVSTIMLLYLFLWSQYPLFSIEVVLFSAFCFCLLIWWAKAK